MLLLITPSLPSSISLLTTKVKLWLFNTRLSFRVCIVQFSLTLKLSLTFDCSTEGLECGGAYLKLLKENADLHAEEFSNASPYVIMFGPDKCGATNKVRNSTGSCFAVFPNYCIRFTSSSSTRIPRLASTRRNISRAPLWLALPSNLPSTL